MKLKRVFIWLLIIGVFGLCSCNNTGYETHQIPDATSNFDFTVLKVGKADAIFMQTKNHNIILDFGEEDDGDKIVKFMQDKNVQSVDYIFITHFDKDHVGGFSKIIENMKVENIIVPNYEGSGSEYKEYLKSVKEKNLNITSLTKTLTFVLDDVLFEVSPPKKLSYTEGDNDFSLAISLTHGKNTFLFTGDAEEERLNEILSQFGKQYDFLKFPHHGRYNRITKHFINAVKPSYSVICDSEKNPAEAETLAVLKDVGSKVYRTKDGNVNVSSDGKKIKINQGA